MRRTGILLLAIGGLLAAMPRGAAAQDDRWQTPYGTFGPRTLGSPLHPKPMPPSRGLHLGPSGNFVGIAHSDTLPPSPTEIPALVPVDLSDILAAVEAGPREPVAVQPVEPRVASEAEVAPAPMPVPMPAVPASAPAPSPPAPAPPASAPSNPPELPLRRTSEGRQPLNDASAMASSSSGAPRLKPGVLSVLQSPSETGTASRAAFATPASSAEHVAARLTNQLSSSPRLQSIAPIQVTVQGPTATLHGTVATSYDRLVAEHVVRMEAGIRNVDNQLQVSPPERLSAARR